MNSHSISIGTRSILSLGAILAVAVIPACDGTPIDEPSTPPSTPTSADETPLALASLTLSTGQVIELFDLDGQAVLSESGEAGQPVVLDKMGEMRGDKLVDLWHRLAPDKAVPTAVTSMQERLLKGDSADLARPPKIRVVPEVSGLEMVPSDVPEGTLAAPVGCNNGCCDYEWLKTFTACGGNGYDYNWFHYNYGWSSVKVYDADTYLTFACAAIGSSQFKVSVEGGGGGSWTLAERQYRKLTVIAPVCCNDPDISSKVNSSTTPALHTHCGAVAY